MSILETILTSNASERIAIALERIAIALERQFPPDFDPDRHLKAVKAYENEESLIASNEDTWINEQLSQSEPLNS